MEYQILNFSEIIGEQNDLVTNEIDSCVYHD
jgi:hypothetical protein